MIVSYEWKIFDNELQPRYMYSKTKNSFIVDLR